MKKQNKLLAFLLVFALIFSMMGNAAIAAAPDEPVLQTQTATPSSPTDLRDKDHVYITIQTDSGVAVGRSGEPIVEFPIYANGENLTVDQLLYRVHESEYHNVTIGDVEGKGVHVKQNDSGAFTWVWGSTIENGSYLMEAGNNDPVSTNTNLVPGKSYYISATSNKTGYVTPFRPLIYENTETEFVGKYWDNGEHPLANVVVKYGTSLNDLTILDKKSDAEGKIKITIPKEGFWYVVFDSDNPGIADAISCVRVTKDSSLITDYNNFTKADGFVKDDLYVIVTEFEGKKYAIRCNGSSSLLGKDITDCISGDTATVTDDELKWYVRKNDAIQTYKKFESTRTAGYYDYMYVYAGGGFGVYQGLSRTFRFKNGKILMHEDMYSLKFDGTKFVQIDAKDIGEAATFELYSIDCPLSFDEPQFLPDGTNNAPIVRSAQADEGNVSLAFVSDVHYDTGYAEINLKKWLEAVEEKIPYIDAMGFCGDMGSAYSSKDSVYWNNVQAILDYMDDNQDMKKNNAGEATATPTNIGNVIYTFGNHEWYPVAGGKFMANYGTRERDYINNTGVDIKKSINGWGKNNTIDRFYRVGKAMDTDRYEIYCLGAGAIADKMSSGYSAEDIASLKSYLSTAPNDIPIFILVHFPLHFWGDRLAGNASAVVNALNESGKNIYLIWGHNHSDFDENYDRVIRKGSDIVIDNNGNKVKINFTYLSAGCISDAEYTNADGGSAWVQGKGVVATIKNDNTVDFTYYTMDGDEMKEGGPYLVTYREGVNYTKYQPVQYVEAGGDATPPAPKQFVNYTFTGWTETLNKETVAFTGKNINRH
ncbi:MAG: DUF4198 domain-containing protein, partial [Lachnospiraceae bacterium]|nr:DUF4198 domain-containing protein [Lachnospiraceae bacterium]